MAARSTEITVNTVSRVVPKTSLLRSSFWQPAGYRFSVQHAAALNRAKRRASRSWIGAVLGGTDRQRDRAARPALQGVE